LIVFWIFNLCQKTTNKEKYYNYERNA
jgi:hypothetical protein